MIPTQLDIQGPSGERERALDRQRAASMADEGGATGAHREMEEECMDAGPTDEAPSGAEPRTRSAGQPRRAWAPLSFGIAVAAAKLIAHVRRVAGRKAASRAGHASDT